MESFRKPFDAAVVTLAESFDRIGPVPLDEGNAILSRGGDIASSWTKAHQASQVIEAVRIGWLALGTFTRTVAINADYRVLQVAEVTFAQWQQYELRRRKLQPWDYLVLGLPMALPIAAEYRSRVQAILDAEARVTTAAASAVGTDREAMQKWSGQVGAARKVQAS